MVSLQQACSHASSSFNQQASDTHGPQMFQHDFKVNPTSFGRFCSDHLYCTLFQLSHGPFPSGCRRENHGPLTIIRLKHNKIKR
jgi:hypothetical protein